MSNENGGSYDDLSPDDFTLESILAEYKGSAFIKGEKRTPTELLNERTEKILREVVDGATSGLRFSSDPVVDGYQETPDAIEDDVRTYIPKPRGGAVEEEVRPYIPGSYTEAEAAGEPQGAPEPQPATQGEEDADDIALLFFDNYRAPTEEGQADEQAPEHPVAQQQPYGQHPHGQQVDYEHFEPPQASESEDTIVWGVEQAVEREYSYAPEPKETGIKAMKIFGRSRFDEDEPYAEGGAYFEEEEVFEEPDLKLAASRFAKACNSISLRRIPAAIISIGMVMLTFAFEGGLIIPFGIGRNQILATGTLMLCLMIVMILCADLILRGAVALSRGTPNAETLILFSCAFSFLSATYTMISGASVMLPYCAVSALSLTFAAFGEKYSLRAITETLKTAASSSEPYGVQAEYNGEIDKSVLKKAYSRTDGFYNNLMHPDIAESAYRYAAPVLLGAALVLSLLTVIVSGEWGNFLLILSSLLAAAAPFSAMLAFSVPFATVAKAIRRAGAAIAGWGGADDVCFTDGASVTDDDLFPPGTISMNGLKLYDGASPEKAIRYTASLIMASGSGLTDLFTEVLKAQGMSVIKVEDFSCYEGGIGALIRGESVATGSAAFMNLLGVRVPDDSNMKNAVYTAVNNRLIAMFTIDYLPINSVQSALISILKWRIKLFFAVRDFNVTPLMLEQKFKVSLEGIEYIQTRDSYSISDSYSGKQGRMAAVLTREGLGPFAEAVTGGRLLRSAAFVATVVSIASAALGVLIMFYICWTGAFLSASPGNLLLFMLSMLAVVLIVCFYVRCRK